MQHLQKPTVRSRSVSGADIAWVALEGGLFVNNVKVTFEGKLPPEEIKRVKALGCLQDKRYPDVFNVRIITRNGKITSEEHRIIAEAASDPERQLTGRGKRLCAVALLCVLVSGVLPVKADTQEYRRQLLEAYCCSPESASAEIEACLEALEAESPTQGAMWRQIMSDWDRLNHSGFASSRGLQALFRDRISSMEGRAMVRMMEVSSPRGF